MVFAKILSKFVVISEKMIIFAKILFQKPLYSYGKI